MTDDFESAVRKIAREKNGDAVTAELVWTLIEALDADGNQRHKETLAILAKHVADDDARTVAQARLQADECARKHAELFGRSPHRKDDPDDADYRHGYETRAEAQSSRKLFSRETLVANFWILVGLLVLSGVVNAVIGRLF